MNEIRIPWCEPEIGKEELDGVIDSFKSGRLTGGDKVEKFEDSLAGYVNAPYSIAVANGTIALDLALKAIGVTAGDEVILPAMTYIATASAISYQNAVPVFVDVDRQSLNLNPEKISEAITKKTKAIIFIDYGGNPANYGEIARIGLEYGVTVLQDGAHSIGGIYKGHPMGAQATISTTSFHMAKVLTTVEGGMIFTHNSSYRDEITMRRNQGESGQSKYDHVVLGTNARMTEIQAGIGLAQFAKLDFLINSRHKVGERYNDRFAPYSDKIKFCSAKEPESKMVYFHYPILIENRDDIANKLRRNSGIDTRICWPKPIYDQKMYSSGKLESRRHSCPVAEEVSKKILNLPIYPSMLTDQVDEVADALIEELDR